MDIFLRHIGVHAMVEVTGRLIANGEGESPLVCTVRRLIAEHRVHIVVDLQKVSSIDAHGLGLLASIYRSLIESGGSLILMAPNARVRQLLSLTRLDALIPICEAPTS